MSHMERLGSEYPDDPAISNHIKRCEQLRQQIDLTKANALREKQNNNKEKALEYLKTLKSLQVELDSTENLIKLHKISQKNKPKKQDAPAPEDFDYMSIVSLNVLEFEKDQAESRNEKEVLETLEMQIQILTNNIQFGVLTQEAYTESINSKISEYKQIVNSGNDTGIYAKHIEIMQKELESAAEEADDDEEEEENNKEIVETIPDITPKAAIQAKVEESRLTHDSLMQNIKYRSVYESYEEGKEAFKYLKNLGESTLCSKLVDKLELWQKVIDTYRSGKDFKADISHLSPSDITGMSEDSRRKEIRRLIDLSISQAAKCKEQALEALRQKDKEQAMLYKREMLTHETKGKQLEQAMRNPWQIPPKISVRTFVKSIHVLNTEIEPGFLEISYGKCANLSDNEVYQISYSLIVGDTLSALSEKFSKVVSKGINHTFSIQIDQRNFPTLYKKHITFEVFEYHLLRSNKSQGTSTIKLDALAKQCTYKTLILLSRKGPQIEVTFKINKSLVTPELKQIPENIECVEDLLPAFKNIEGVVQRASAPVRAEPKQAEEVKQEPINFDDIAEDEYNNPNVVRNLVSFEVLENEIERLKSVIVDLRSSGQSADSYITLQRELMRNKSIMSAQVENGMITTQQYKSVLESQVEHDLKLAQFYKQRGKRDQLSIVVTRVKIMRKEIQELSSQNLNE